MELVIKTLGGFAVVVTVAFSSVCVYLFLYSLRMDKKDIDNQTKLWHVLRRCGIAVVGLCILGVMVGIGSWLF